MKPKHIIKLALLAAAFSGTAQASGVIWQIGKRMASANGNVVIGEFTNNSGGNLVGYEVDLSSSTQIHLFAVSHGESDPGFMSAPNGWTFTNVAKANWATGSYGFQNSISGASLGSFESLFGTVDTHVIVFTAPKVTKFSKETGSSTDFAGSMSAHNIPSENYSDSNEANWSELDFTPRFLRGGSPATEFIAVSTSGSIVGQSIPEPSTALLGSLAALALLRRRR